MTVRRKKAPGIDVVHNEMVKLEPDLMAVTLVEMWKLVGRSRTYPASLARGLLTPIYKKGEIEQPQNYLPVCMLSHVRKIVEVAIAKQIANEL